MEFYQEEFLYIFNRLAGVLVDIDSKQEIPWSSIKPEYSPFTPLDRDPQSYHESITSAVIRACTAPDTEYDFSVIFNIN